MMFEAFGFSRALSAVQNNISATFGAPALVGSPALTDTVSFFRCHRLRSTNPDFSSLQVNGQVPMVASILKSAFRCTV